MFKTWPFHGWSLVTSIGVINCLSFPIRALLIHRTGLLKQQLCRTVRGACNELLGLGKDGVVFKTHLRMLKVAQSLIPFGAFAREENMLCLIIMLLANRHVSGPSWNRIHLVRAVSLVSTTKEQEQRYDLQGGSSQARGKMLQYSVFFLCVLQQHVHSL